MGRPYRSRRLAAALLAGVLVVGASAGCSSGGASQTAATCDAARREPLDSNLGHVLPGAPEPQYRTDPPTSGPHAPGVTPAGVLTAALSRPAQVGALEAGVVLVQYRDLAADELARLTPLATGKVVVAPNPNLPERVVATAWLTKQVCRGVDVDALRAFATANQGHGPGTDG